MNNYDEPEDALTSRIRDRRPARYRSVHRPDRVWPFRGFGMFVIGAIFVVVFVTVAIVGYRAHTAWTRWCGEQGGTVQSHTDWGPTTYDRDGNSHSSSNTTYYCFRGGQIIGIR